MKLKRKKVLCVDDEPINLQLLEAVLKPNGYDVILTRNGSEALEVIRREPIDILLLDVMMPDMDGYEVCRIIKGDEKFRNIPIVMITALTEKDDRIKGIEAGAEEFLSKPFNFSEVLARVKMLIKMKELNDRLHMAYKDIVNLTKYGGMAIQYFNPVNFNLKNSIDSIINQAIRQQEKNDERPELFVVGINDEKKNSWHWTMYRFLDRHIKEQEFDAKSHELLPIPESGMTHLAVLNAKDMKKSEMAHFFDKIRETSRAIDNAVLYLSSKLCIFALNYGHDVSDYDASVLNNFVVQSLFLKHLSSQVQETEDAFEYLVYSLARAAEINDEDTGNHIIRVGRYCEVIAEYLGMDDKFIHTIKLQATLHDVGKIHTPPEILKKPGKLTSDEWVEMKKHTIYGAKIIGDHYRLGMAANIARTHHEKWDGSGYPHGLSGEEIPIEGRIISIADIYDALRNARVYKPAFDAETTSKIILEGDGRVLPSHFDARIIKAFKENLSRFGEIYEELRG
ncbi:MAG: response regulator [Nitrospirae bacterium]|nr:response regulator [Nitrospirota bacterium]